MRPDCMTDRDVVKTGMLPGNSSRKGVVMRKVKYEM